MLSVSCTDEWLKPIQYSSLDPDNAYSTYSGCQSLVTKLCKDIRPEFLGRGTNMRYAYECTDLSVLVNGSPRDYDGIMVPSFGGKVKSLWDDSFKSITRAAMLVTRSETMVGSQAQKDEIRACGEFFMGYWYYRLITTYGNIPLILEEIDYPKLDFQTSTMQRIITHMIEYLEDAVKYLPEKANAGSLSKPAANMLLTKYYLMNGDFEKAVGSSTEVIETPGLALMTGRFGALVETPNPKIPNPNVMTDLFYKYNPSLSVNTEKIFVVLDSPTLEGGLSSKSEAMREFLVEWYNGQYDQEQPVQQMRTKGLGNRSTIDGDTGGKTWFSFSSDETQDRQILWIGRGIGTQKKTAYFSSGIWQDEAFKKDMRHNEPNWYPMEKLVYNVKTSKLYGQPLKKEFCSDTLRCWDDIQYNKVVVDDEVRANDDYILQGGCRDWYVYRLAEAYLMRAEANVWLNHGNEAANDINIIRNRAGAKSMTGEATLDDVLDERARELFLEEFRRSELVRIAFTMAKLGKDGYSLDNIGTKNWYYDRMRRTNNIYFNVEDGSPTNFSYAGDGSNMQIYRMSPYHIFWPIPESAINDNSMAVLNQNYGYVGYENNVDPLDEY